MRRDVVLAFSVPKLERNLMNQSAASPSAKKLLKFYRRENEVGVFRIKMSASDFAAHRATYLAAASVPFKTETVFLDHQVVPRAEGVPDTALEARIRSSENCCRSTEPNDSAEAASPVEASDVECPPPAGEQE
jgi:hypothetical protein